MTGYAAKCTPEPIMRDVINEFKALRLHGMAATWADILETDGPSSVTVQHARGVLTRMLEAEQTDRAMRSISHQMSQARFPAHRDLAGFDFESARVDRQLINALSSLEFTEAAHNVVLIGGPGTGNTHLATAVGIEGITRHNKRVRFTSTVWIWSKRWRRIRRKAKRGALLQVWPVWTCSFSISWVTCHSPRPGARCCFICSANSTSTTVW